MRSIVLYSMIINSVLFYSCTEKESLKPEFVYIDRVKGLHVSTYDHKKGGDLYTYTEAVLVKNPPEDTQELKQLLIRYRDSIGVPLHTLDSSNKNAFYSMSFYKYTDNTASYTDTDEKGVFPGDRITLTDQNQEYLGSVYSERCKQDSTQWITQFFRGINQTPQDYDIIKDTITNNCNQL